MKQETQRIKLTQSQKKMSNENINVIPKKTKDFSLNSDSLFQEEQNHLNEKHRHFTIILSNISTFGRELLTYFLTISFKVQQKQYSYKSKVIHGNSNDRTIFDLAIDINFPQNKIREHSLQSEKSKLQLSMLILVDFTLKVDQKYEKIGLGKIVNPFVGFQEDVPIFHLTNQNKKIGIITYKIDNFIQSVVFDQKIIESSLQQKDQQKNQIQNTKKEIKQQLSKEQKNVKFQQNDNIKKKQQIISKEQSLFVQQQQDKKQNYQNYSRTKHQFVEQIFGKNNGHNLNNKEKGQDKQKYLDNQVQSEQKQQNSVQQQFYNQEQFLNGKKIYTISERDEQTQNKIFSGNLNSKSQFAQNSQSQNSQQGNLQQKMIQQLSFLNSKIEKDLQMQKDQNQRYMSFLNESNTFINSLIKPQNQSSIQKLPGKGKSQNSIKIDVNQLKDWNQKQNQIPQSQKNFKREKNQKNKQIESQKKQLQNLIIKKENKSQANSNLEGVKKKDNNYQFKNSKDNSLQISRIQQTNNNNRLNQIEEAELIKTISQISDSQQLWKIKQRNRLNSLPQKKCVSSQYNDDQQNQITFSKENDLIYKKNTIDLAPNSIYMQQKYGKNNNKNNNGNQKYIKIEQSKKSSQNLKPQKNYALQNKQLQEVIQKNNINKEASPSFLNQLNQSSLSVQQQITQNFNIWVVSQYNKIQSETQQVYSQRKKQTSYIFLKNISLEFSKNHFQSQMQWANKNKIKSEVYQAQLTIKMYHQNSKKGKNQTLKIQKIQKLDQQKYKLKEIHLEENKIFEIIIKGQFWFAIGYKKLVQLFQNKIEKSQIVISLPLLQTRFNQSFFIEGSIAYQCRNNSQLSQQNKKFIDSFFGQLNIKQENASIQGVREVIKLKNISNIKKADFKCNLYKVSETCIQTLEQLNSNTQSQNQLERNQQPQIKSQIEDLFNSKKIKWPIKNKRQNKKETQANNHNDNLQQQKQGLKFLLSKKTDDKLIGKIFHRSKKFVDPAQKFQNIPFVQNQNYSPRQNGKHQPKKSNKKLHIISVEGQNSQGRKLSQNQNKQQTSIEKLPQCEIQSCINLQTQPILVGQQNKINSLGIKTQRMNVVSNTINTNIFPINSVRTNLLPENLNKSNILQSNSLSTNVLPMNSVLQSKFQVQRTKNEQIQQMSKDQFKISKQSLSQLLQLQKNEQKEQILNFLESPIEKARRSQQPSLLQLQLKKQTISNQNKKSNKIVQSNQQSYLSYLNNENINKESLNPSLKKESNNVSIQQIQLQKQPESNKKIDKYPTKYHQSAISSKTQDAPYKIHKFSRQPDDLLSDLHSQQASLIQKFHQNAYNQQDFSTIKQKRQANPNNISLKVIIQTLSIKMLGGNAKFTNGRYVRIYVQNNLKNKKHISQCIQTDIVNCNNHLFWNWNHDEVSFFGTPQTKIIFEICQTNKNQQETIIGSHQISLIQLVQIQKISMYSSIVEKNGKQIAKILFGYMVNTKKKNKDYSQINKSQTSIKKHSKFQSNDTNRMTQIKQNINLKNSSNLKLIKNFNDNSEIRSSNSFNIRPKYSSNQKIIRPTQNIRKSQKYLSNQGSVFMLQSRISAIKSRKNQKLLDKRQGKNNQKRVYMGGNIKIPKAIRFMTQQQQLKKLEGNIPGPGAYEVHSFFQRHSIKQP